MLTPTPPKIIGICGFPCHGKSTAQEFLVHLGVEARDDGDILRKKVAEEFGLTWEDVTTQEGKLKVVPGINGEPTTVRKLLGDYGKVLERTFGQNYIAQQAIEALVKDRAQTNSTQAASFGSIRMNQPAAYKAAGGFVIEILDPRKPTSPLHDFDEFDRDYVDVTVINDGDVKDLNWCVFQAVVKYLQPTNEQVVIAAQFI